MNTFSAISLSLSDLLIAALLIALSLIISLTLSLKLEKALIIATLRTVIQLSLIGLALSWIFAQTHVAPIIALLCLMTLIAAWAARNRISTPYRGLLWDSLLALMISCWSVALVVVWLILQLDPWYQPQYIIPLLGLILGNALTGISLTMEHLIDALHDKKAHINNALALGATPWEACREQARRAITLGMMPTINSMTVVGLVSLPGMMTGQILAGADPTQAVRYQILTMFMIAAGSALGCMIITLRIQRRFFDQRSRLLVT
ncbi:iron export ABC transporter permease subunit FetB [Suttonella sp. R2A3]|uniref:ABC transporter permease n=1 Tax=Suttonella sp. R2A3 TaxID=2908648 RepID=UPI001F39EBB9|nr:iron export ABC transporter permease subunit FetB [Suttonella sp. R2A3]UJF24586.1 iron export ABC transporter permease subunit FetB [Suttonella sp. R2A3]